MSTPLRHWNAGPNKRVAIVGYGGPGYVGVAIAVVLGGPPTVLDLSADKRGRRTTPRRPRPRHLGRPRHLHRPRRLLRPDRLQCPADLDHESFLALLALDGTFVQLGVLKNALGVDAFSLLHNPRSIAGTLVGGIREAQEMLDFCGEHGIGAEVEIIAVDEIDTAYDRAAAGDVRYRFVIDISTMAAD
ncbi:hypothetical protein [Streptomyces phaeochromogenes]|uniref:hypothetical protein n=1 Tax=Streptomyces phaeochromogenes TaxID=1923 RepID=UPI002DD897E1|nr:hypothetical protein [Streptomyces phaeochromogenes]